MVDSPMAASRAAIPRCARTALGGEQAPTRCARRFSKALCDEELDLAELLAACARPRDLRKRCGPRHDGSWPRKKAHEAPGVVSVRRATARELARYVRVA
jgi:hypothetical protein